MRLLRRAAVESRPSPTSAVSRALARRSSSTRPIALHGPHGPRWHPPRCPPTPAVREAHSKRSRRVRGRPCRSRASPPTERCTEDLAVAAAGQGSGLRSCGYAGLAPTLASRRGSGPLAWIVAGSLVTLLLCGRPRDPRGRRACRGQIVPLGLSSRGAAIPHMAQHAPEVAATTPVPNLQEADRGHPPRQVRGRRRRRRPRERGRPDDRGRVRHAGGDQLHGDARARAHLPLPDRGALRRARPCGR